MHDQFGIKFLLINILILITLRSIILVAFLSVLAITLMVNISKHVPSAWAKNDPIEVYKNDSSPYGQNYPAWTAKWWIWLMSIPTNVNPAADSSGIHCAQGQIGPVWFLAGSTTGNAERVCSIPAGKSILFPLLDSECSYAEFPRLKTESDLRACAVAQQNEVTHIEVTIDGTTLARQQVYRVQTPLFNFTFPNNNLFGAPPGPSQSVADGFYVFLPPLSTGKHDIMFKAVNIQFTTTGTNTIAQNIIYHLTVK
jgi:hypothetical protein